MNIDILYNAFLEYRKISIDSRNVEKNSLFFALKGENFDGNKYAADALKNGSSFAVVDDPNCVDGSKYILVDNVLRSLQELANYHRTKLKIPIIAITGTNGKTTTKELTACVLNSKYNTAFTKGNLNNHIGVPLTLLSMDEKTQIGIVEMGANHLGEIESLCKIAEPDYGIITNIGVAHLEGFGSFENVIQAKTELYLYLKENNGKVFYNYNDTLLRKIINELDLNSIAFGNRDSEVSGEIIGSAQFLKLKIHFANQSVDVETQLVGNYNMDNIIAASAIGCFKDISPELIVNSIENYKPKNNRSQFLATRKNNLYLDAYNANPTSVRSSLQSFLSLDINKKMIILGDMLELGDNSVKEHEQIVKLLQNEKTERVLLVGSIYNSLDVPGQFIQFEDTDKLMSWLKINNIENLNILIKGSRGIGLERIVELL